MITRDARAWLTDPVESGTAAGFGVYIHIPFCATRCGYCDFAVTAVGNRTDADEVMTDYVNLLVREIDQETRDREWPPVTSVFIGGGTPTLLGGEPLARIMGALRDAVSIAADAEVTVECNPETATADLFEALVGAGVNRLSLGAQSFSPHVLAALDRRHTPANVGRAVDLARDAGIDQISVDLIFGTPGETAADWQETLARTVALGVDHLSAYALTVHENTPLGRDVATGAAPAPDDDVARERFDEAGDFLAAAGFAAYEVSNWSTSAATRSRHNSLYWRHGDYLAFGVGAHGHVDGRRFWRPRSLARWREMVLADASRVAGEETLSDEERAQERLLLGLRLKEGLHPNDVPPIDPMALEDAMAHDLVTTACGRLQCTESGWFLLDEAIRRLT